MATRTLPGNITRIGVAMFENRTSETGAEHYFTEEMIYELAKNGHHAVAPERAEAVIKGVIESITTETVSRRALIDSAERRITVKVGLQCVMADGSVVWASTGISDAETYGVYSQKVATEYGKRQALRTVSERIAEEAYRRLTMAEGIPVRKVQPVIKR